MNETGLVRAPDRKREYARAQRWIAFALTGGLNTTITILLAWALMVIVDYRIAYLASFVVGIVIANYLYSTFVFRVPARAKNALPLGAWYAASGVTGTVLVSLMTEYFGVIPQASVVLAAALMTPVNYVASKSILSRTSKGWPSASRPWTRASRIVAAGSCYVFAACSGWPIAPGGSRSAGGRALDLRQARFAHRNQSLGVPPVPRPVNVEPLVALGEERQHHRARDRAGVADHPRPGDLEACVLRHRPPAGRPSAGCARAHPRETAATAAAACRRARPTSFPGAVRRARRPAASWFPPRRGTGSMRVGWSAPCGRERSAEGSKMRRNAGWRRPAVRPWVSPNRRRATGRQKYRLVGGTAPPPRSDARYRHRLRNRGDDHCVENAGGARRADRVGHDGVAGEETAVLVRQSFRARSRGNEGHRRRLRIHEIVQSEFAWAWQTKRSVYARWPKRVKRAARPRPPNGGWSAWWIGPLASPSRAARSRAYRSLSVARRCMASASASGVTSCAISPVCSWSICSRSPPTGVATTGSPQPKAAAAAPDWLASV